MLFFQFDFLVTTQMAQMMNTSVIQFVDFNIYDIAILSGHSEQINALKLHLYWHWGHWFGSSFCDSAAWNLLVFLTVALHAEECAQNSTFNTILGLVLM